MAIQSKTVINSMIWNLLERFSSQIVSFAISIILARLLLPSDYGIIAIIMVFIALGNVIIEGGLNTALVQKKDANQTDFSTIFWFCLFVAVILYIILFFAAPLIASLYKNDIIIPVLRVLSLGLFLNSFNSIQRAFVARHMLFRKLFYVNALALLTSGGLGVTMAYSGFGLWALVAQTLMSPMVCCALMWFTIRWRPTIEFSKDSFRSLFDFGWKILATNFVVRFFQEVRSLAIGKLYQPATLGFFDRGKSLPALLMNNITTSINTVLLPTFSNEQDNPARVKQMMRRAVQVSYLFVAPILIWFFFASKEIVLLLLTEKWLPAVPFIQIFCIAYLLMPIQNVNVTAIQSLGYSGITLKLEVIKKTIEVVILVVSFMINVYAIAWGIVVYNIICIAINLRPIKRLVNYGLFEQIIDITPTIIASLIMGGAVYACELLPWGNLVIIITQLFVGAFVYFLSCKLFKLDSLDYVFTFIKKGKNQ